MSFDRNGAYIESNRFSTNIAVVQDMIMKHEFLYSGGCIEYNHGRWSFIRLATKAVPPKASGLAQHVKPGHRMLMKRLKVREQTVKIINQIFTCAGLWNDISYRLNLRMLNKR